MAPKQKRKKVAPGASPQGTPTKKKEKVKESESEEEEDDADADADADDALVKPTAIGDDTINAKDLSGPPPPRKCTQQSPSKATASSARPPAAKKLKVEDTVASLDTIMIVVSKVLLDVKEMKTTLSALAEKSTKNTRGVVDLTQISDRLDALATAVKEEHKPVKEEPKSKFSMVPMDEKLVLKFCAHALSVITMWPKIESPGWLKLKTEAFGLELAGKPELDQAPPSNFIHCYFIYIYICSNLFFSAGFTESRQAIARCRDIKAQEDRGFSDHGQTQPRLLEDQSQRRGGQSGGRRAPQERRVPHAWCRSAGQWCQFLFF
jgi:hypothetical protein